MHRRYGDVFTIRVLPGGTHRWCVFNRPEHVKEIFAGDPEVFHAGKGNAILGPVMGEHSLLLGRLRQHKRARTLLMPAFNGHALRGYRGPRHRAGQDRGRPLGAGRVVPLAGPDERAHPRGDPPGRLRRHRRGPARRAAAAGQPHGQHPARWSSSAGASRSSSASGRGSGRSRTRSRSTSVIFAEIASAASPPTWPSRSDVLSRLLQVRDEDGVRPHRRGAARPAGHAAARRPRDHGDRARLGAARARPRTPSRSAGRAAAAAGGDDDLPRGRAQGVDAAAPGDPDGGAAPDGAGDHRRDRPAARRQRGPSILLAHESAPTATPTPSRFRPERFLDGEVAGQHLDPVRRRGTPLHRGRVLADGGRRRPARGAHGVRRDAADRAAGPPKVRNITSVPRRGARLRVD